MFNCIIILKKILKRVGKQTNKKHCICSKSDFHISFSFPQILNYSHLSKNVVYFTVSSCEEEKEHFQSYSLVLSIRRKYLLNTCYLLFSPEKKYQSPSVTCIALNFSLMYFLKTENMFLPFKM